MHSYIIIIQSVINHPASARTLRLFTARCSILSLSPTVSTAHTHTHTHTHSRTHVYTVCVYSLSVYYVWCVHGCVFLLLLYIPKPAAGWILILAYCFFSDPRQTNTHTHPVLISMPTLCIGDRTTIYDGDDYTRRWWIAPGGFNAAATPAPRVLSLAPAPKTANLNLRIFCLYTRVQSAATEL